MTTTPTQADLLAERKRFNTEVAGDLCPAGQAWQAAKGRLSSRFAWFETDSAFLIVAGVQERGDTDLALAYGLKLRGTRRLHLVVPSTYSLATLQRSAFLHEEAQPVVCVHDIPWGASKPAKVRPAPIPTQEAAIDVLRRRLPKATSPSDELADASTPKHLGDRSGSVAELVEWATKHASLDSGHRRGERAWHCMGQKVLSIKGTKSKGLSIAAGIHYSRPSQALIPVEVSSRQPLDPAALEGIQLAVTDAIELRSNVGGKFHKPDEHWLQAAIRLHPELVGVEQPALRELPAWRPGGGETPWGRGYIDLIGLDGAGDIRIVETKLAKNSDDLLIFQGLDYYLWAKAYEEALRVRLGAAKGARFVVHYVIGENPTDQSVHVSSYAAAQAVALTIPWRCQVIRNWFSSDPETTGEATGELLAPGVLP